MNINIKMGRLDGSQGDTLSWGGAVARRERAWGRDVGAVLLAVLVGCSPAPDAPASDPAIVPEVQACDPLQIEVVDVLPWSALGAGERLETGLWYVLERSDDGTDYQVFVGDDRELRQQEVLGIGDSDVGTVDFLVLHLDDGAGGFTLGHELRNGMRRMVYASGYWAPRVYEELLAVGERLVLTEPTSFDGVPRVSEQGATVTHLADLGADGLAVVTSAPGAELRLFVGPPEELVEHEVLHSLGSGEARSIDFLWAGQPATLAFLVDADGPTGVTFHYGDEQQAAAWLDAADLTADAAFHCL